jgi:hypothetical protein
MNKGYLNFEQVKKILFPQLEIVDRVGRYRSIYKCANNSIVAFSNSKDYGGEKWWYSIFVYEWSKLGVEKVCLTLGEQGIVVLPMTLLLDYAKYADYNDNYTNGKRFFIRIKKENGNIILYHSGQNNINITPMFHRVV